MHEARVFLVEVGFKVHRGLEAEGAVETLPAVKDFDPFKADGTIFLPAEAPDKIASTVVLKITGSPEVAPVDDRAEKAGAQLSCLRVRPHCWRHLAFSLFVSLSS